MARVAMLTKARRILRTVFARATVPSRPPADSPVGRSSVRWENGAVEPGYWPRLALIPMAAAETGPPSMMRTTVRGIGLAGSGYVASQALNFAAYLVLVRLLTPRAFGLYAAGSLITGIGGLFAESGMLAALIKREDRLDEAASTAFVSLLITGVGITLGSLALSPLLGLIFHSSEVGTITAVLSGWLFIRALTIVPDALLQRNFSFLRRIVVDPLGVVAYAAAAIPLAAVGAGVWAMVAGAYASIIVEMVAAWIASGFRPRLHLVSMSMWRDLSAFARPLVAGEVLRRITSQLDVLMLGILASKATLGQYRNGQMLAGQPGGLISQVTAYVILPAFARISSVPERIAAAARHAYWVAYSVVVPMALACLPLGVPVAVIFIGDRWRPAGHAIAGLSGMVLGVALLSISGELEKAIGALRFQLRVQTVWLLMTVATVIPAALIWGLLGVAIAVSISACANAAYAMIGIAKLLLLPPYTFFTGLSSPLLASVPMVVVMLLFASSTHLLSHGEVARLLLLIAEILLGGLVYLATLAVLDRPRRRAAVGVLVPMYRRWRQPISDGGIREADAG